MPGAEVLIDGAHLLKPAATGIGSYARTLLQTLASNGCRVSILCGEPVRARNSDNGLALAAQIFGNQPAVGPWARRIEELPFIGATAIGLRRRARAVPVSCDGIDFASREPSLPPVDRLLNANKVFERSYRLFAMKARFMEVETPDGVAVAHWTMPTAVKMRGVPNIYTIHDLIPLQFPHFVIDRAGHSVKLHYELAKQADHIVTVSETSKRHIVELLKVDESRVTVTFQPAPRLPDLKHEDAARLVEAVYGVQPGAYALFLGAIEPKKNLRRLIEAFLLAGTGFPLLIAGPDGWLHADDLGLIERIGSLHRDVREQPVRRLGYLPRRDMAALLKCARFMAFPSIYEGFGLPVLEAMQMGVPVLTSSTSSLPEVAGDAAVLVDPLDIDAISDAIRTLASDADIRADLADRGPIQAAKFSEAAYRERLVAAYRKVGIALF